MEENEIDRIAAEEAEQRVLLDKGLVFKASGKEYLISQPRIGQMDKMAVELLKLDLNSIELESQEWTRRFSEQKRIIHPNAKLAAKIVAIAAVNHHRPLIALFPWYAIKERFLVWKTTNLFLYNLSAEDLFKLVQVVLKTANLQDFTSSIALLSINRTTAPQAIEEDQQD